MQYVLLFLVLEVNSNQFTELYALTQAARSYALLFRLIQSIMAMPCSLCVYLMLMDVTGHDKVFQASPPSVFAYWNQSNAGGKGLGMRLCYASVRKVCS